MDGYYNVLSSYKCSLGGLATTVFTKRLVCHITNHQVVIDTSSIIHNSHKSSCCCRFFFVRHVFVFAFFGLFVCLSDFWWEGGLEGLLVITLPPKCWTTVVEWTLDYREWSQSLF